MCLGASSDLKQATSIATHMVKDWGMSEKMGLRTMAENPKSFQGETLGPSTSETVTIRVLLHSTLLLIFLFSD